MIDRGDIKPDDDRGIMNIFGNYKRCNSCKAPLPKDYKQTLCEFCKLRYKRKRDARRKK